MKELCPSGDNIDIDNTKTFYAGEMSASNAGTAIDQMTSTVNSTTVAITLGSAIAGLAPAGAAVTQLNTGATGVLAAPVTAADTVVYVTVTSGAFDNTAANTLTVGSISGAKAPDASTDVVVDYFGLPAEASCETLYTDYVRITLASGVTVGATASIGDAVAQSSRGAEGTVAVAGSGSSDTVVYVTVTSGTFDATGDVTIDGGSAKAIYAVDDPSTEPVSFTRGTSTSTPYVVTGVYTPTSGQVRGKRCHLLQ